MQGPLRALVALGVCVVAGACGNSADTGATSDTPGSGGAGSSTMAGGAGTAAPTGGNASGSSGQSGSAGSTPAGSAGQAGTASGGGGTGGTSEPQGGEAGAAPTGKTYAEYADEALGSLLTNFYVNGKWKATPVAADNTAKNHDWGDDSLSYDLYFRWQLSGDATLAPKLEALAGSLSKPPAPCAQAQGCGPWSDEYLWDSLAASHMHEVTAAQVALDKAIAAFDYVDKTTVFSGGMCPGIYYQRPDQASGGLKTAETDTNYLRAAIALYERTKDGSYLDKAKTMYAAIRKWYLDTRGDQLYSVYVFDTGGACAQKTGRYYSSVNGNMIYSGIKLQQLTGDMQYLTDAIATAHDVDTKLADASGIHADLQAENDLEEPLVEAMYALYADAKQDFAKTWLLRNAAASVSSIQPVTLAMGRFFNGPPPTQTVTEFQTNGGYALLFAAAKLDPTAVPPTDGWKGATLTSRDITTDQIPASIQFTGRGITLYGTIGEQCCEAGHAKVFIDGTETTDTSGIWQNKSSTSLSLPDSILFSWSWPTPGPHTVQIQAGLQNAKEGGSFVHIQKYSVLP
jgi:hypothetical protein